ncbi:MOSC domain-containing protein [Pedobacter hartonius]|uniref:MOSC domain-containing protein n=1 Tax=Pedobacter hartonius TaxID=425514 RepID=A0A1H4AR12_9SPHI|nr:MOSC N-terminal beta barrel domain-containing protein [Pedobacter hartonius]SEA38271.1 hypothetical protein SAMN05443550_10365 [Pedobacter hartonius]
MNELYLSELHIYPIKSLGGMSLQQAQLTDRGLKYDRRWMLIDAGGTFVTQRKHFELAMLQVSINDGRLTVTHKKDPAVHISFSLDETTGISIPVNIWDDQSTGLEVSTLVNEWFTDFMQMDVRLVQMPADERRLVDPRYAEDNEIVSFADGYPCLIISQASLDGLNGKLTDPVRMDRFRPNLVFTGGEPHIEDKFTSFYLGDTLFSAVKPCARCVLTTIDQQTGAKGQEPLKTLAGYRTVGKKVLFGQNLIHKGKGLISVGDQLRVTDWKPTA